MNLEKSKKIKLIECAFGSGDLEVNEKNIHVSCPACKDSRKDKKKLYIELETGWYNCWVCNISGKKLSYLFKKFASKYVSQCQALFGRDKTPIEDVQTELIVDFPDDAKLVATFSSDPDARDVYSYLRKRGLSRLDMLRWRVCYSNEYMYRRKAIFPSFDAQGKINYFVVRSIDETKYKYNNAKIPKSSIIFNEIDMDWSQPVILVEGVFDAVKCPDNTAIALGSTLPKKSELYLSLVKNQCSVVVCFDEDAEEKSHDVCKNLKKAGCKVYKVTPTGPDLGDRTKKEAMQLIKTAKLWTEESRISHKISCIKSGSII